MKKATKMKPLRTLIVSAAFAALAIGISPLAAAPTEAVLRDKAIVVGDTVTLGDLFMNAGDKASTPVSRAPAPGQRAAINSAHVANAARAAGLLWPNHERYTHLIVNRDGTPVTAAQVHEAIALELSRQHNTADTSFLVELDREAEALYVAKGTAPRVIVTDLTFDARTGHFNAHVKADARGAKPRHLTGRATLTRKVPVPAGPVARGEVMRDDMLTMIDMEVARIAPGTALSRSDLVGMAPRTALRRGQSVRVSDLHLPVAVEKDARVTLLFEMPGMVLTATGRALEDAPIGGLVRVINTRSHRTVHARVITPDRVVVESSAPVQVAGRATE